MSGAATVKERPKKRSQLIKEKRMAAYMFQLRLLMTITMLCCLSAVVWLVALVTDHWILVDTSKGTDPNPPFGHSHAGLWRICFYPVSSANTTTDDEPCSYHNLDPAGDELRSDPDVANTIIDYRRSVMALAVLSTLIMVMGVAFSFYVFCNKRYTFKRLAAGIHFLTASMTMVLIQVVLGGAEYARERLPSRYPDGSVWEYGYSFYLAYSVFGVFALAFLVFMATSGRVKGDRAATDELDMADKHVAMGR